MKLIQFYEPGTGVRVGCVGDHSGYNLSLLHPRWKTVKDLLESVKEEHTSVEGIGLLRNIVKQLG